MTIKSKGLIIKETKIGEGDKIITILTPQFGIIQAVAKGARSYKSKFLAGCQLFCYTAFELGKRSKLYSMISAEPIHTFFEIRESFEKLSLAVYFCDLINEVCTDTHSADPILRLALNTFYMLAKSEDFIKIKATFELRLISEAGFRPALGCCTKCGDKGRHYCFSAIDGGLLCDRCGSGGKISSGTLKAMLYIISAPFQRVFSFKAHERVLEELECICEGYALNQIGRCPRSLQYYKNNRHGSA